jgi:hypothetical protein
MGAFSPGHMRHAHLNAPILVPLTAPPNGGQAEPIPSNHPNAVAPAVRHHYTPHLLVPLPVQASRCDVEGRRCDVQMARADGAWQDAEDGAWRDAEDGAWRDAEVTRSSSGDLTPEMLLVVVVV